MESTLGIRTSVASVQTEGRVNTIIIGASAAGLACAAALAKRNIPYVVVEKSAHIAAPWRNHYDRLHLNTEKWTSHLPYLPFPKCADIYIARDAFVDYLEHYASVFGIRPSFGEEVHSVEKQKDGWKVKSNKRIWTAENVIIATGLNRKPVLPEWPGMEAFKGEIIHSAAYKNGRSFKGKRVLVVGFGNSACEISICLHEHGAFPALSVKGAVNIVPRQTGGKLATRLISALGFLSKLFPEWVDMLNGPLLHRRYGPYSQYGLQKLPYGPSVQIIRHKRVPLLDIGTVSLIRKGLVKVYPGIRHFTPTGVCFTDGKESQFDKVILATGYTSQISEFMKQADKVTDATGRPLVSGSESALNGLYFCGFSLSPTGMLNQIGKEAKNIARLIQVRSKK